MKPVYSNTIKVLTTLGAIIDTELEFWEIYFAFVVKNTTYDFITEKTVKDPTTMILALKHLLSNLPARYQVLAASYHDSEIEKIEISKNCTELLKELQQISSDFDTKETTPSSNEGDKNPPIDHFQKHRTSKKIAKDVKALERGLREEEKERLQELRRLKAIHICMVEVCSDGELGLEDVSKLANAMDEMGLLLDGIDIECDDDS